MPPAGNNQYLYNGCVSGKGYSYGWSIPRIIKEGKPASLCELFDLIMEKVKESGDKFSGPIAFNSLDILASPLIGDTELDEPVSNFLGFMDGCNIQTSFSVDLIPPIDLTEYSKYQNEIDAFNESFVTRLGEMFGNRCIKPSILLNIHDETIWNQPLLDKYLELSYRHGNPIIQNKVTSTISHEETRPDNQDIDNEVLYQRIGGPHGNPDDTGVHGYVNLNLAKMGKDARSEDDFFDILDEQVEEASRLLEAHRETFSQEVGHNHLFFSSIVPTGMNEGLGYLIDAPLGHVAGKAVTYKVVEFLVRKIEEIQYEAGNLYSLESFPSDINVAEMIKVGNLANNYLTRGTELPHTHGDDLWDALEHQKKLQSLYSGGELMEIHVEKGLTYHKGCKLLTKRIIEQFGFNYFAVSPSIVKLSGVENEVVRFDGAVRSLDSVQGLFEEVYEKRVLYDVKNR